MWPMSGVADPFTTQGPVRPGLTPAWVTRTGYVGHLHPGQFKYKRSVKHEPVGVVLGLRESLAPLPDLKMWGPRPALGGDASHPRGSCSVDVPQPHRLHRDQDLVSSTLTSTRSGQPKTQVTGGATGMTVFPRSSPVFSDVQPCSGAG